MPKRVPQRGVSKSATVAPRILPINGKVIIKGENNTLRRRLLALIAGGAGVAGLGLGACSRDDGERPWKGARFPAFVLPTPDGAPYDSRKDVGRPLLINFWATWCPPCRKEMADLDALYRALQPKGLQLLAISVDSDQNLVREYLRHEKLGFTVLIDAGQQWSAAALRIPGFPTTYLVGGDGLIVDAWIGPRTWAEPSTQAGIAASAGIAY